MGHYLTYGADYQRKKIFHLWVMKIHIGNEISRIQKTKGISNEEMADAIGTTVRNWSHLKNRNDLAISQLLKISERLDFNFFSLYNPTVRSGGDEVREELVKYELTVPRHTLNFQVKYPAPEVQNIGKFMNQVNELAAKYGYDMV